MEFLSPQNEVKFNGATLRYDVNAITISQKLHIDKVNYLDTSSFTTEQFVTERAREAYIAAVCRTDCTYAFSKLSEASEHDENETNKLKEAIKACK